MPVGKDGEKLPYKGEPGYEEAKAANPEAYANEETPPEAEGGPVPPPAEVILPAHEGFSGVPKPPPNPTGTLDVTDTDFGRAMLERMKLADRPSFGTEKPVLQPLPGKPGEKAKVEPLPGKPEDEDKPTLTPLPLKKK
jgi:hypothetical protein